MQHVKKLPCFSTLLFLAVALFLGNSLWAEEKGEKPTTAETQEQPRILLDSTQFYAGEVDEGTVIVHDFTVKNTGKAPLTIEKVKAG